MTDPAFKYVLGEKDDLVIVLFYGRITQREIAILEQCEAELKAKTPKVILLNFRDLQQFLPAGYAAFAKLQKTLRDTGKEIALCGLKPDVKESLLLAGIVRENELFNNIPEAWKVLKVKVYPA